MARPASITQEDVESAASVLKNNGKPINPYQVRKILGKGSVAKIGYFLKALGVDAIYETDDPLTARLALLLRPAALELEEQTSERIHIATEQLQKDIDDRDDSLEDLGNSLREKQSQLDATQEALNQAALERDSVKSENQGLELKCARLEETVESQVKQLAANAERIAEMKAKSVEARDELLTTLSEHKEAIRMMREDHQRSIDGYKEAVSTTNQKLHELAENREAAVAENIALKQELQRVNDNHQATKREAEQNMQALRSEATRHREQIKELSEQCSDLTQERDILSGKLKAESQASKQQLATVRSNNERFLSENTRLVSELDFLKTIISKFEIPLNQEAQGNKTNS